MKAELIRILKCPLCESESLDIHPVNTEIIKYHSGIVEEIKDGFIICNSCCNTFKIEEYIPSFPSVNKTVIMEGNYWGNYYCHLFSCGIHNFVDIKKDFFPFYNYGITTSLSMRARKNIEIIKEKLNLNDIWSFQNEEFSFLINNDIVNEILHSNTRVLEIGCGSGWLSLELKRRGFEVIGIDPAMDALKIAKKYAIKNGYYIEYINTSAEYLPFKDNSFDGCFAFHALHHVPNLEKIFLCLRQIVKEGGVLSLYEHRKNLLAVKMMEFSIYFMLSSLLKKRISGISVNLPKFTSINEDISVSKMDSVEKYFDIKLKCNFHHIINNLPLFLYYLSNRDWKWFIYSALLINEGLKLLPKSIANFALYVGINHK
jgi:2-polyprenyl-3-methyl-5-hydroxy-6-metoxy-1,4-benzoquinol methylase/uncharacterized protein YbaR (Trm112 family)